MESSTTNTRESIMLAAMGEAYDRQEASPHSTQDTLALCADLAKKHDLDAGETAYLVASHLLFNVREQTRPPLALEPALDIAVHALQAVSDDDPRKWFCAGLVPLLYAAIDNRITKS